MNSVKRPGQLFRALDLMSAAAELLCIPICPDDFTIEEGSLGRRKPDIKLSRKLSYRPGPGLLVRRMIFLSFIKIDEERFKNRKE